MVVTAGGGSLLVEGHCWWWVTVDGDLLLVVGHWW